MNRDFPFAATPAFVLDQTAVRDGGSRLLSHEQAKQLAAADAANANDDRPQLRKRLPVRRGLLYRSGVDDQHGSVKDIRTLTAWGGYRRAQRAYERLYREADKR